MHKIRQITNINGYSFPKAEIADKFDYIYRKYLDLPFDFSIQILTGDNIEELDNMYVKIAETAYDGMSVHEFVKNPPDMNVYYRSRINDFKKYGAWLHNIYKGSYDNATILFHMPEIKLSISQQQNFLYDCLMALKDEYLNNPDKPFYKHVNFFVITTSVFMMSDCLPGNILVLDSNDIKDSEMFAGNLYDLAIMNTDKGAAAIAENVIKGCVSVINDENADAIELDFIGDSFVRGSLKKKQLKKR